MSATRLRARLTCCQGPHSEIMVVYVLLLQSRRSSLSSGSALTQSNSCHALQLARSQDLPSRRLLLLLQTLQRAELPAWLVPLCDGVQLPGKERSDAKTLTRLTEQSFELETARENMRGRRTTYHRQEKTELDKAPYATAVFLL